MDILYIHIIHTISTYTTQISVYSTTLIIAYSTTEYGSTTVPGLRWCQSPSLYCSTEVLSPSPLQWVPFVSHELNLPPLVLTPFEELLLDHTGSIQRTPRLHKCHTYISLKVHCSYSTQRRFHSHRLHNTKGKSWKYLSFCMTREEADSPVMASSAKVTIG